MGWRFLLIVLVVVAIRASAGGQSSDGPASRPADHGGQTSSSSSDGPVSSGNSYSSSITAGGSHNATDWIDWPITAAPEKVVTPPVPPDPDADSGEYFGGTTSSSSGEIRRDAIPPAVAPDDQSWLAAANLYAFNKPSVYYSHTRTRALRHIAEFRRYLENGEWHLRRQYHDTGVEAAISAALQKQGYVVETQEEVDKGGFLQAP